MAGCTAIQECLAVPARWYPWPSTGRAVARVGHPKRRSGVERARSSRQLGESAAQIPNSRTNALTLARVTSQPSDSHWRPPEDSGAQTQVRPASASLVDPEDDLPSATYAGDFETTTIPHYNSGNDSGNPRVAGSGYGVIGQQDASPYGRQQPGGRHSATAPDEIDVDEHDERVRAAGRRGTQDLGLLILRVGLGAVLVAHGLQKLFGWWGGRGLTGFKDSLSDVGYRHAEILTYVGPGGEIVAGVLLVLGLFTPLAAAGALAYLINGLLAGVSTQPHSRFSFFLPHGHEYEITLIVAAAAVILIGPGRYGFDAGRGWARRPFIGSFAALLGGVGAGIAVWVLLNGANPLG
jgi:putative oxidoreductase